MMNKAWPWPTIIAHRGGGKLAPENTLAAIDTGASLGHKMIEFDVKLSLDGEIFLLHDDTLDRTSDGWGVAGELPWEKLRKLDASKGFGKKFAGERLPLLWQVAERCARYQMMANIEIKPTTGQESETGRVVAMAARDLWHTQTAPLLSSFSIAALEAAKAAAPELPRGLLLHAWHDHGQAMAMALGCVSIHLNHKVLTETRVAELKKAKLRVLAYTVNTPARARELLNWGVDTLCTDNIALLGPDFPAR